MRSPIVKRKTLEHEVRRTRRRIVEHLRANPRGLVLLDNAAVTDCEIGGSLTVLGDYALIYANLFTPVVERDEASV